METNYRCCSKQHLNWVNPSKISTLKNERTFFLTRENIFDGNWIYVRPNQLNCSTSWLFSEFLTGRSNECRWDDFQTRTTSKNEIKTWNFVFFFDFSPRLNEKKRRDFRVWWFDSNRDERRWIEREWRICRFSSSFSNVNRESWRVVMKDVRQLNNWNLLVDFEHRPNSFGNWLGAAGSVPFFRSIFLWNNQVFSTWRSRHILLWVGGRKQTFDKCLEYLLLSTCFLTHVVLVIFDEKNTIIHIEQFFSQRIVFFMQKNSQQRNSVRFSFVERHLSIDVEIRKKNFFQSHENK